MDDEAAPATETKAPDSGWSMIPPLGTPHEPKADPEFTIKPVEEVAVEDENKA